MRGTGRLGRRGLLIEQRVRGSHKHVGGGGVGCDFGTHRTPTQFECTLSRSSHAGLGVLGCSPWSVAALGLGTSLCLTARIVPGVRTSALPTSCHLTWRHNAPGRGSGARPTHPPPAPERATNGPGAGQPLPRGGRDKGRALDSAGRWCAAHHSRHTAPHRPRGLRDAAGHVRCGA